MNKLFLNEIEPLDETYRSIRDDLEEAETKVFVEHLWEFFCRYTGDRKLQFKSDIAKSFHAKFWEMYLAYGLHMQGAMLQPTSSTGPDLLLSGLPHPVWVEATAPLKGDGPDQVPEMCLRTLQEIPSEALILRYRNRIDEKYQRLQKYLAKGVMQESDPYIIAINGHSLPFANLEPEIPRIVQALFGFGNLIMPIDRTTMQWGSSYYEYRPEIKKKSGEPVSTNIFRDPTYDGISAVLSCLSGVWNHPHNDAEVGLDFLLIHNPLAKKNKVPHQWLKCGREYWVEDDQLVIKNWYKEHPSYPQETKVGITLAECIQEYKAQKRVKHGNAPKGGEPS
jgi:hypothetical protein